MASHDVTRRGLFGLLAGAPLAAALPPARAVGPITVRVVTADGFQAEIRDEICKAMRRGEFDAALRSKFQVSVRRDPSDA